VNNLLATDPNALAAFSFYDLGLQLLVAFALSYLLQAHLYRYGNTYSNRHDLRPILPAITLTTLLVISVVKSSLALSLGLVGALSIVRFRTPIKEPEELAYLFMAIAIGLGMGANQILTTTIITLTTMVVLIFFKRDVKSRQNTGMHLALTIEGADRISPDRVNEILAGHLARVDLQRYGSRGDFQEFVYHVDLSDPGQLSGLSDAISSEFPDMSINFVHAPRIPGL